MKKELLTWLFSVGLVSGICMMGAEGPSWLAVAITGGIGLAAVFVFGALLIAILEANDER